MYSTVHTFIQLYTHCFTLCYHFSFIETAPKPEYEKEDGYMYEVVDDEVIELDWDHVDSVWLS